MTVAIELTRTCDAPDIARALAARGLDARPAPENGHILVRASDLAEVEHALDAWVEERGLPFVPFHVDERTVCLAPPPA